MKILLILFKFTFLFNVANSQIVNGSKFIYDFEKEIYAIDDKGINKKIGIINYEITIFQSDSESISIAKPLYLNKYPNGEILIYQNNDTKATFGLSTDSIADIGYYNSASLISKQYVPLGVTGGVTYINKLKEKPNMGYIIEGDSVNVEGLMCYKAKQMYKNITLYDVLFYKDIKIDFAPVLGIYPPGLIVNAISGKENGNLKKIKLISYELNISFDKKIFNPIQLNKRIVTRK